MKTKGLRLSLTLIGLMAITAPGGAHAASPGVHLGRTVIHATPTAPDGEPSLIG